MMSQCDIFAKDLTGKKCVPCEGGIPPLKADEATRLLQGVKGWKLHGAERIEKEYVLGNFVEALAFVNRVGAVAESEGHHPDVLIYSYKKVRITLYTHAVSGLTENDFIVAAKIDALS